MFNTLVVPLDGSELAERALPYARPGEAAAPPFDSASAHIMVPLDGSAFAETAHRNSAGCAGQCGWRSVDHRQCAGLAGESRGSGGVRAGTQRGRYGSQQVM